MELLGDMCHVESRFGPFGDSVVSAQDTSMVCVKRTIGLEIILDTLDGTPNDEAQVEARFDMFGEH
jgi:hypothetical protein